MTHISDRTAMRISIQIQTYLIHIRYWELDNCLNSVLSLINKFHYRSQLQECFGAAYSIAQIVIHLQGDAMHNSP